MYKLLVMDVDGTLTNGEIYMSSNGEVFKAFNVKDGYGIKNILKAQGIQTAIITGRQSEIVKQRAAELDIDYLYQGVSDKLSCLRKILEEVSCSFEDVVYVGDDVNDLPCMENVGWSCCPSDAHDIVKMTADYVTKCKGGQGAVREIIDLIVMKKQERDVQL